MILATVQLSAPTTLQLSVKTSFRKRSRLIPNEHVVFIIISPAAEWFSFRHHVHSNCDIEWLIGINYATGGDLF
jgi:hypothetical protein